MTSSLTSADLKQLSKLFKQ